MRTGKNQLFRGPIAFFKDVGGGPVNTRGLKILFRHTGIKSKWG
jgi:hypothetical protein